MHITELRPVIFTWKGLPANGAFHCWGSDATAYEGVPMTVGIIEDSDGKVRMVEADKITFSDRNIEDGEAVEGGV